MRIVVILFFLLGIVVSCQTEQKQPTPPVPVTAFEVNPETVPAEFEFVGVAKSSHPVQIRSRVEGYLMSINYTEGSVVEPNQLMFRIDPRQFEAEVDQAKAELARQEAVLWRSKKALERIEPLYKQNAASLRDFDDATAEVLTAEASVMAAKAKLWEAELNLSYTYISSPIKGMAGKAQFREGDLITPSINGYLTEVSVIDPIWIYFSISENELLKASSEKSQEQLLLPKQQNYTVSLIMGDGSLFPYTGTVNFSSPTLDPKTGTLNVRAQFPNPKNDILPGQFVQSIVCGAFHPHALYVPQQSVFQGNKGRYVFVINKDNTVSMRLVDVGDWFGNYWIIKKGISAGEIVVNDGVNKVQEGGKVQITSLTKAGQEKGKNYINNYETNDVNKGPADQ